MLGELSGLAQRSGEPGKRRWFADEEMDLIVWYSDAGAVTGFQLCYDKSGVEHALTWRDTGTLIHEAVDQGEDLPTENRTPILSSGGAAPLERVARDFAARSAGLETELRSLVLSRLGEPGISVT